MALYDAIELNSVILIHFLRSYGQNKLTEIDVSSYPWEILIRQARKANLLSRVAVFLRELAILDTLPARPKIHFYNAITLAEANSRSAKWEVYKIHEVLYREGIEFALLKGVAYILSGADAAKGRLFSDTDILVSKRDINDAELALLRNGWYGNVFDKYNQRYYRKWMHEIPPLRNLSRRTSLDVHHAIMPPTSRLKPKSETLWQSAISVPQMPGTFTLSSIDMILHSATHLFHEGEFSQGLRDISDLDLLLREFIENNWNSLLERSVELNLEKPLYYALNYTNKLLFTPIPIEVVNRSAALAGLNRVQREIMDILFLNVFIPEHESCLDKRMRLADWILFIRSHWLKMPWYLLIPHLSRKAWMRLIGKEQH